ncbi:DUF3012 domain-containing protein [Photobacterium sanctipauli]|uniref:DUF3012 domain-containing protein n=1 Tax=Photobacterium sanctipauli TaxID=1342794 RepID=A0A2T3NX55_9GAMM|nr:DUF3012 domain-containing protein [Photobacterium sanctipauli]PSW20846.1 DUF3012 domain-containing protein [Photobacterium sanctipauli]
MKKLFSVLCFCFAVTACTEEVGSEKWCEGMKEKPKGDWTANEAKDFTQHCLFKSKETE